MLQNVPIIQQTGKPVVYLVSPRSVFASELSQAIKAMHMEPIVVSEQELQVDENRREGDEVFAICWLDIPLFLPDEKKKESLEAFGYLVEQHPQAQSFCISFDLFYSRTGKEGREENFGFPKTVAKIREDFPHVCHLAYQDVFYPYEEGLSYVGRFIKEKLFFGGKERVTGICHPLWYEDVITHILEKLCSPQPKGGDFRGNEKFEIHTIEEKVRFFTHTSTHVSGEIAFPFVFPEGQGIRTQSFETIAEEFALSCVHSSFSQAKKEKVEHIKKTKEEGRKKRHISSKPWGKKIQHFILLSFFGCLFAYTLGVALFLGGLFHIKQQISTTFIQENTDTQTLFGTPRFARELEVMTFFAREIPVPYHLLGMEMSKDQLHELLLFVSQMSDVTASYKMAFSTLQEGYTSIFLENESSTTLSQSVSNFEKVSVELSQLQAKLGQVRPLFVLGFGSAEIPEQMQDHVVASREELQREQILVRTFSQLVLSETKQTVAVVLLSPTTIRPFGGTPEQVILASFQSGKLLEIEKYSADQLNSLLVGTVVVPSESVEILDKENWELSDGALSLDGTTSSRQIAWFLQKQLRRDIQAMFIARMDSETTNATIKNQPFWGNIRLAPDALALEVGQTHTKSVGVHEFVQSLEEKKPIALRNSLQDISHLLSQSKMAFYVKEASRSASIAANGWDGRVMTPVCPSLFFANKNCVVGTGYVWEYTQSGDKNSVQRNFSHQVSFSSEKILHERVLEYAPTSSLQGEPYTAYIQYAVDESVFFTSVSVNDVLLDFEKLSVSVQFGKKVVGIPIVVEQNSPSVVRVLYEQGAISPTENSFVFFEQKQTGIDSVPLQLTLRYEEPFFPKKIAPEGKILKNSTEFTTTLNENKIFAIGF